MTTFSPVSYLPLSAPLIVRGGDSLPAELERPVLAIGNFDGVHRGHQSVIKAACELGRSLGKPTIILTFEPHPRSLFAPSKPMFRITPPPLKAAVLQAFGADAVIVFAFNATFAGLTATQFIDDLLIGRYNASGVVVGHDFHFGKGREGSPSFLVQHASAHAMPVVVVEPVLEATAPVSSSAIRNALSEGDIATANHLLGYRWIVQAEVVHGEARGRDLGYPTANMRLDLACGLRLGIYAVRMRVDGVVHTGVASFGKRPTFDDGAALLETHLFNFSGNLYGKRAEVEFLAWLRPELKFDDIAALIAQMDDDSAKARIITTQTNALQTPSLLS